VESHFYSFGFVETVDQQLRFSPFKNFRCQTIQIISSFRLTVGFWEVQEIKSQNLQTTHGVLDEYSHNCRSFGHLNFKNRQEHNRLGKFIHGPRQDCNTSYVIFMSVLLLTIALNQSARENLHSYSKTKTLLNVSIYYTQVLIFFSLVKTLWAL